MWGITAELRETYDMFGTTGFWDMDNKFRREDNELRHLKLMSDLWKKRADDLKKESKPT